MNWLISRLAEHSTHNALASIFTGLAVLLPNYQPLLLAIAGALAGSAAIRPER